VANTTYATDGAALRLAEVPTALLHLNLADRVDLSALCVDLGDAAGSGSSVGHVPTLTLTDNLSATAAEDTDIAATSISSGQVQLTVVRYSLVRKFSDLFAGTSGPGQAGPELIAADAANAISRTRSGLVAGLFGSASNDVGDSGVDLSVSNVYSAMYQLMNDGNSPRFACVLAPVQLTDFMEDMRGEAGPQQWIPASQAMLAAKGPGFSGEWNGIEFYTSPEVDTANAGADRQGCMFAQGAIGYREMSLNGIPGIAGISGIPAGLRAAIEFDRTGTAATSAYTVHYYPAFSVLEADRMVSITTDA